MFYFAHPFGITSPATGAKLAQIRDRATKGCKQNGPPHETAATPAQCTADSGAGPPTARKPTRTGGERNATKAHRSKVNGLLCAEHQAGPGSTTPATHQHRKHHRTHRRISNFEKFLLEIRHSHTCAGGASRIRRIDREDRLTPLVPWPSIIWNRDFLIPTLLQALAQQHGKWFQAGA
uniref:Uncharacterized protein n=1 Tax=Anopheles dirus TaxID=7168 RepID=A0A182N4D8_9DIPT